MNKKTPYVHILYVRISEEAIQHVKAVMETSRYRSTSEMIDYIIRWDKYKMKRRKPNGSSKEPISRHPK